MMWLQIAIGFWLKFDWMEKIYLLIEHQVIAFQIEKQSLRLPWHRFADQWINTGMPGTFQTVDTWVVIPSKAGLVAHRMAVKVSWIEVGELKVPQSPHTTKWEGQLRLCFLSCYQVPIDDKAGWAASPCS